MVVIRHQDKCVHAPARAGTNLAERANKTFPIALIAKNRFLPVTAIQQMIDGTGKFHAGLPGHPTRYRTDSIPVQPNCRDSQTDPLFPQLEEKKDAAYATLSGGQKQRLALALALINEPQLLFLDEPTTGLDPQVRLEIRDLIEELRADNRTILLTTHYIEEAERLCDRVAIIDAGNIIAMGTPRELQEKSANQSAIEIRLTQPLREGALPDWIDSIRSVISEDRYRITVYSKRPARTLVEMVKWVDTNGFELDDVHLSRPTLEDVFIELTGKKLRD